MGDGLALLTCYPEMMRTMSDIPTDLLASTPPQAQRCVVNTRVSMDNAEDNKLSSVQALLTERLRETARVSELFSLPSKAQLIHLLLERVVVGPNDILVRISAKGVFELICDLMQAHKTDSISQTPDQTPRK